MRPTYLVWTRLRDGRMETKAVHLRESGVIVELGRRSGLWLCDGERLFELRYSSHPIRVPDWESVGPDFMATKERSLDIEDVALHDFDSGASVLISPVEPREFDDAFDIDRRTQVNAGAGPFLFVVEYVSWFVGGAHGNISARSYVVDIRSGLHVESLSSREWAGHVEPLRQLVVRCYSSECRLESGCIDDEDVDGCALTLFRPVYRSDGHLSIEWQFSFPVSYAASDGLWSSYTRSTRVVSDSIPCGLVGFVESPPDLSRYLASFRGADAMGWSVVPDTPRTEGWLRHFHVADSSVGPLGDLAIVR